MKTLSTFSRFLLIGATVSGVYFFEWPRAWAAELPAPADAVIDVIGATLGDAE